jgi:hypothetical protein
VLTFCHRSKILEKEMRFLRTCVRFLKEKGLSHLAQNKSHIKTKKSVEFFSTDFNIFIKLLQNLMKFGLSYSRGFCSALSETAPWILPYK